jgi:tetratricopeptide (TPR) repeat protein
MSNSTFDVFISYSHLDAGWVRDWLLPHLEAAGLRVCLDERDFAIGAPSIVNMENAVEQSRKTLLVLTPAWVESEWTKFESLLSQTDDPSGVRRRTLPLMLEKCEPPKRLGILTHADFTDPARREAQLARLVNAIRDTPTDERASGESRAPTRNLVHPYPLQANFTGRVREREELTAWLADDAQPVCALVAMGGMGKSALAWVWVKNDVLDDAPPDAAPAVDGVMWWSFYEGESSFARFIDEALRYVGARPIDATQLPTTYDRAQELRRLLQTQRVLFVLDGFERQLRAYASLDAAYKQDDAVDPSRESRSCVDPTAMRFIRDVAAATTRAKLLLTTRLMPSDLEDRAGDPLAGAVKRELKELPRDDALRFMRAQGVTKGTDAEIAAACDAYGYHPLSLRLLSGLIARDTRTPGDIAAAPRVAARSDFVAALNHILEQSFNALPKRERALLSRIAAFRNPMDYAALSIFNTLGNEARFDAALEDLRARGLLQRDFARNCYDLHPIVRRYAYDRLANKRGVHSRLRDYFANIDLPDEEQVQSVEDLAPVIELYYHTASAGNYDDAFELFHHRLNQPLYYRFGAYQIFNDLCGLLFPDGEGGLPQLRDKSSQVLVLSNLANSYGLSGQSRRAVSLVELANLTDETPDQKQNLITRLQNISHDRLRLGELAAAEQNLRQSIGLCLEIKDEFMEAVCRQVLGQLLTYRGEFDEAEKEFNDGIRLHPNTLAGQWWKGTSWLYWAQGSLLRHDIPHAIELAREAERLKSIEYPGVGKIERDIIYAKWLVGASLVTEGNNLNDAYKTLADALTRCRRINLVEFEPDILLALARWHYVRGDAVEARAHAEQALAIADRGEFRLKQTEIHNFLARVALEAGERDVAKEHAEVARERAWCDGPPHCYRVALDEAEGLLRELGAGEEK